MFVLFVFVFQINTKDDCSSPTFPADKLSYAKEVWKRKSCSAFGSFNKNSLYQLIGEDILEVENLVKLRPQQTVIKLIA